MGVGDLTAALAELELTRPDHVEAAEWQRAVEDGRRFLVEWGRRADELGWTADDLFGLPPVPDRLSWNYRRLARLDLVGVVWLLRGRAITAVDADAISIDVSGAVLRFYRRK